MKFRDYEEFIEFLSSDADRSDLGVALLERRVRQLSQPGWRAIGPTESAWLCLGGRRRSLMLIYSQRL
ncbi:MAG TPA: hypothetical protein VEW48_12345, partial [Thermoanaerobaculia bacterium]|nr:hypothetical protein [Thermoanaerobaculia bacterium]